jgi:2-polyprenyl-6-methoxyphenol hydroxylase-like FAD-dependent oxidoreductase
MKIAINGAGIAGPTLAFWLARAGHEVVIVEEAKELRTGGYIIDFWGVGYDIAEKMGLVSQIRDLGYQVKEVRFVDDRGHTNGGFSVDVFQRMTLGRFTSVRRSDLAATIYGALPENVSTIFDDSIVELTDTSDAVEVGFKHAPADTFDLVIGADGLHSKVRAIAFGPEDDLEVSLGYHVAAFEIEGYGKRDELVYVSHGAPGRQVSRFSMRDAKTLILFVFSNEYLSGQPHNMDEQKAALREIYAGVGWECPAILAAMYSAGDIYFDSVSQIRMDRWTRGRTALIGDAAGCASLLAGEGTGLAMAEAYVLAGELARHGGDHEKAFAAYERLMMPFIRQKQKSAASFASSFAPKTSLGITFRNLVTKLLRIPFVADYFIGADLRDDIDIPNYTY